MFKRFNTRFTRIGLLITLLLLAGCGEVIIFNDLESEEANEIMAILLQHGVNVDRSDNKDGASISIPKTKIPFAINLLNNRGYPQDDYTNVIEVFSDSGLVTTDFERRIRYNFAASQQISETLSHIDGVVMVRVLLSVSPIDHNKNQLSKNDPEELSAAVFIKHNPGYNLENEIAQIKLLVSNSIANLKFQNVSVSMSASKQDNIIDIYTDGLTSIAGIQFDKSALPKIQLAFIIFFVILLLNIAVLLLQIRSKKNQSKQL